MKLLSTGNIFVIMGKLIEFFETIARAGAFLPAGIYHAKRIMFSFSVSSISLLVSTLNFTNSTYQPRVS